MKSECTEVKPVVSFVCPMGGNIMAPKDAYVLMPNATWQEGIKVTDVIKVTNQLTLIYKN